MAYDILIALLTILSWFSSVYGNNQSNLKCLIAIMKCFWIFNMLINHYNNPINF